jgi:hypothetical protein
MLAKDDLRVLAERCRDRASHACFPGLEEALLRIADQYELEARVTESSLHAIMDSERLIDETAALLKTQVVIRANALPLSGTPLEPGREQSRSCLE